MNKFLATAAVGIIITTSTVVMAQVNVPTQTPTNNMGNAEINVNGDATQTPTATPNMAPQTPSEVPTPTTDTISPMSPVQPTPSNNPVNVNVTGDSMNKSSDLGDSKVSITLNDAPKADSRFLDQLADAFNSKNIDAIVDMLSNDGFVYITERGEILSSKEAVKHHFVNALAGDKKATLKLTSESIMNVAPGVAIAVAKANLSFEGNQSPIDSTAAFTLKYEDGNWKIVSKQVTPTSNMNMMEHRHETGGMKLFIGLIFGGLLGFLASRFMSRRNHPMGPTVN